MLYSLVAEGLGPGRMPDEFDMHDAAQALAKALPEATICPTPGDARHILRLLDRHRPDVVFNACEAPLGRPELEAHPAALLEWTGIRFTGCGSETLALCRRKDRVNALLADSGVPVPPADGFPCIVKPADQDGSVGIGLDSVCADEAAAAAARARLPGPALTQRFLPGREFAVALWGRSEAEHDSVAEYLFSEGQALNTYLSKWQVGGDEYRRAQLDYRSAIAPPLRRAILAAAAAAWRVVGARGYLRVDLRLDAAGRPCVLDVNPNPSISPETGIHRAAEEAGWTWERFVRQQLEWA